MLKIGEGTYGKVYKTRATEAELQNGWPKFIALKVARDDDRDELKRELQIYLHLHRHQCRGLVNIHAATFTQERDCIVMDYIPMKLTECKELAIKNYMHQILTSLKDIHQSGIVHGDLKPGNILFCPAKKQLYIIDFGLSHAENQIRFPLQTEEYRAPEVWQAYFKKTTQGLTTKMDCWSAGAIMLEMFMGWHVWTRHQTKNRALMKRKDYMDVMGTVMLKFNETYKAQFPDATAVIAALLEFEPNERASAKKALEMPFFR